MSQTNTIVPPAFEKDRGQRAGPRRGTKAREDHIETNGSRLSFGPSVLRSFGPRGKRMGTRGNTGGNQIGTRGKKRAGTARETRGITCGNQIETRGDISARERRGNGAGNARDHDARGNTHGNCGSARNAQETRGKCRRAGNAWEARGNKPHFAQNASIVAGSLSNSSIPVPRPGSRKGADPSDPISPVTPVTPVTLVIPRARRPGPGPGPGPAEVR
jgi:hypothetical protein